MQISSIQDGLRTFNDNVNRISDLHSRSLNNMDDGAAQRNASQLDELVAETSALSTTLKRRIKALEKQGGSGRDGQIRKQQVRILPLEEIASFTWYTSIDPSRQVQVCGSYPTVSNC